MARRRIKPFNFFFNTKGKDEHTGTFYIQPDAATVVENMNTDKLGQWSTYNQGYERFTAQQESGSRIDGAYWFTEDDGTDHIVIAVNGKLKDIDDVTGAVSATPSTGLTAGNPTDFETFKGNLYVVDGTITPIVWSGSGSASSVAGIPLNNGAEDYGDPLLVEKYNNRLVYGNFRDTTNGPYPSHIAISDDLAPDTFTLTAGTDNGAVIEVSPGDGQSLLGLKSKHLPNSNEDVLLLFKDRSIYALEGRTQTEFNLYKVSGSVGALNNRCIVEVGPDIIFMDEYNIHSLSTANESGTMQPKLIGSEQVETTLRTLNVAAKSKAWAIHLPHRNEVWFAIPTGSNTEPDTIIQYHYERTVEGELVNSWAIRKNIRPTAAVLYNSRFFTGDTSGYINEWHNTSTYAGDAVSWRFQYPYFNFSTQAQNKRVVEAAAWFILRGEEAVTITTQWRGGGNNTIKAMPKTVGPENGAVPIFGSAPPAAVFGQSYYGSEGTLVKVKFPVYGNGEQLQLTFAGSVSEVGPVFLGVSGLVEYMGESRSYK